MPQNAKRSKQLGPPTVSRGVKLTDPSSRPLITQLQRDAGNAAVSSLLGGLPLEAGARAEAWLRNSQTPSPAVIGSLISVSRWPGGGPATLPGTTAAKAPASSASAPPGTKPAPAPAPAPTPPPIAWISDLPKEIQDQIDNLSAAFLATHKPAEVQDQRDANRGTFMETMKWLFGSYANAEAHFRDIKPMANAPNASGKLWAHVSTRERLLQVQEDLKGQNIPMPQTSVALGLRGWHLNPHGKGPGFFTHATGFAIDWHAYAAPHITDPSLIALFETVSGGAPHFDLKMDTAKRLDLIEKMGQGTADKAESDALLQRIEDEYKRLVAGSDKFKTDLPETSLLPLREVRDARAAVVAAQGKLDTARHRGTKAMIAEATAELTSAKEALTDKLDTAKAQLKQIFEPWTKLIDARIAEIDKVAADQGVDLDKLTPNKSFRQRRLDAIKWRGQKQEVDLGQADVSFEELTQKLATIGHKSLPVPLKAKNILAQVDAMEGEALVVSAKVEAAQAWLAAPGKRPPDPASVAQWGASLDDVKTKAAAVRAALDPVRESLATLLPGPLAEHKPPAALRPMAVSGAIVSTLQTAVGRLEQESNVVSEITERFAYREETVKKLGGTGRGAAEKGEKAVTALLYQKMNMLALKAAKELLETNAEDFVFKARDAGNPAIMQLLGLMSGTEGGGFFTPQQDTGGEAQAKKGQWSDTHGFGLPFMKSMVSHGFELGVAWAGWSDTMHFELVEGRELLEAGGKRALSAGGMLKTLEVLSSVF